MTKYWFTALIILLNSLAAAAEELDILVVGLFADKAVVEVNGERHLLKVGKSTPEGIKLIAANSSEAVLEIKGERQTFPLGDRISTQFSPPPEQPQVSLWPTDGMYLTTGTVNGYTVDFLVDTGAFSVALNAATAERLGIDFYRGEQVGVRTASGTGFGYKVTLDYVQIDDIKVYNVGAVVLDGPEPSTALLGMTFLGQLDIEHNGERLDLRQKY
ncbi:TIGR02281 family clan AA aspartic protease [Methylophaga sp.]|uniref:retropepsin-like aspartic protease family protein n=1 Tax=Methylophaga sp. TaxID=2024840 RepID=UPI0025E56DEB|nr:TIGR02281 family clan AA aspartic protease [Methylophaga sp.]